jgi:hypothetical protein
MLNCDYSTVVFYRLIERTVTMGGATKRYASKSPKKSSGKSSGSANKVKVDMYGKEYRETRN